MTRSPFSCVLWDIDGTVVDASEGILHRLTITLDHFGHPAPTHDQLIDWIGPPMHESFQKNLGMTPEKATEAVSFYRVLGKADGYTTGARLYPGVADLIVELNEAGVPQSTASSKPEIQVRALMEHFGLAPRLREIVGATSDEKTLSSKADIVGEALRRLKADGVDVSRPVLVGDRHHDVEGGAAQGVPVIFVSWGFSTPDEARGAIGVAADIDELRAQLMPTD